LSFDPLSHLLLRRHPANPKAHDSRAIGQSFERFGYVSPVVVNDADGHILEGHGRVETLQALKHAGEPAPVGILVDEGGEWHVPAVHGFNLDPTEVEAFLIAANRTVELGGWNPSLLAELLDRVSRADGGLAGTGFTVADLEALIASIGGESQQPDPEDAPPSPRQRDIRVRPGELYRLGEHRLLIGDAVAGNDVTRLAGNFIASCLCTDPPYGVEYAGGSGLTITNDDAASLPALLRDAFGRADTVLAPGAAVFLFHPSGPLSLSFGQAIADAGWLFRQSLVWIKDSPVLGHSDFHYRHEPIIYARKPGAGRWGRGGRGWYGGNDATTVFEFPRPKASRDHPTMKPVRLVAALLDKATRGGDIVLDPFAGSGSTLIACELLGRRFLGIEIDPAYAQVAMDRWEAYTGLRAQKEDS